MIGVRDEGGSTSKDDGIQNMASFPEVGVWQSNRLGRRDIQELMKGRDFCVLLFIYLVTALFTSISPMPRNNAKYYVQCIFAN